MRHIFQILLCFPLFVATNVHAQGFLQAKGKKIVDEKEKNVLLRGIGLGGWMLQEGYMLGLNGSGQQYKIRERIDSLIGPEQTKEFYKTWLNNHTTKADIDSLKKWGFNSVRLPMHFNLYTLPIEKESQAGKDTWLEEGFALTDSLLSWCKANEMYLILDLHAAPGGQGNDLNISDRNPELPSLWQSPENKRKTVALWRKLAERYRDEPWIGGYDLINEPNWGFQDPGADKNGLNEQHNLPLKNFLIDITRAIREVDTNHILIIEGNGWGNNYNGMLPPWDSNMVLSFHKYWNYNDTASIGKIIRYRNQYNVPVWLGETGENSNTWFTEAVALLEKNNIGWAWWPLKKIGFNNPLQIRTNPNYQDVLQYWNEGGRKPRESNAYSGLLELAAYTNIRTNIIHYDVIDALTRQPSTTKTKAFQSRILRDSLKIKAVDYDLGRNRYAYFDKDTANYHISSGTRSQGNKGRTYRNDGVDIKKMEEGYERYYVTDIEPGEFLQYSFSSVKAGVATVKLKYSSQPEGGKIKLTNLSNKSTKTITLPTTGANEWKWVELKGVSLNKGENKIRVQFLSGGIEFSELVIR